MKILFKILGFLEDSLCCISIVIMIALAFANVIGRHVLHSSISFTEEIVCGLFVLTSMMGTSIAIKHQSHLGLNILTEHLPEAGKTICAVVTNLLGFACSILLIKLGYDMCMSQIRLGTVTATLQWPGWIYGMFLPIGAVFMAIRFLEAAVCQVFHKEVL